MKLTSAIAIYALFLALSAFMVLPFGVRTHEEMGIDRVPGQADSAPHVFSPGKIAVRALLLSVATFGLYYANYVNGWVDRNSFGKIERPREAAPATP